MSNNLLIVDVYGLLFRAYYGIKPIFSRQNININAVYGTIKMLLAIFNDVDHTHLILTLDGSGESNRAKIYEDYKANRISCPEDLKPQFDILDKFLSAMQIKNLRYNGLEADDIIYTYAKYASNLNSNVVIATFDKDLMQLVSSKICIYNPKTKNFIHEKQVIENFGVLPEQIQEYLALIGDASDNIPGVPGIGPKKAVEILAKYKSIDEIYQNINDIMPEKTRSLLINGQNMAHLSLQLTKLIYDEKMLDLIKIESCNKFNKNEISQNLVDLCKTYSNDELQKLFNIQVDVENIDKATSDEQCLFNFV